MNTSQIKPDNAMQQAQTLHQLLQLCQKNSLYLNWNTLDRLDIHGTELKIDTQTAYHLQKLLTAHNPELAAASPYPDEKTLLQTNHINTLLELAANPTTSSETLAILIDHPHAPIGKHVAQNRGCSPELIDTLIRNNHKTTLQLLQNPSCSSKTLLEIAKKPKDTATLHAIALNPNCPAELRARITQKIHLDPNTLLESPDTKAETLQKYYQLNPDQHTPPILQNPNCPGTLLEQILQDLPFDSGWASKVASHKNITLQAAEKFIEKYFDDYHLISILASNKQVDSNILQKILYQFNDDEWIIANLLKNPTFTAHITDEQLQNLLQDPRTWVKIDTLTALENPEVKPSEQTRKLAEQTYHQLLASSAGPEEMLDRVGLHILLLSLKPHLQTIPTLTELLALKNEHSTLYRTLKELTIQLHLTSEHTQKQLAEASNAQKLTLQKLAAEQNIPLPEINTTQNLKNTPGRTTTLNNVNKTKKPNITITP